MSLTRPSLCRQGDRDRGPPQDDAFHQRTNASVCARIVGRPAMASFASAIEVEGVPSIPSSSAEAVHRVYVRARPFGSNVELAATVVHGRHRRRGVDDQKIPGLGREGFAHVGHRSRC
jgi:hypothetical protein